MVTFEQKYLGRLLLGDEVQPADFDNPCHAGIFHAVRHVQQGDKAVDFVTVLDAGKELGYEPKMWGQLLAALVESVPR